MRHIPRAAHDRCDMTGSEAHPDHQQLIHDLDEAPMRLPHYLAWGLSTGGTLLDGVAIFMLGITIPLLNLEMALSTLQTALLGAGLVAGAVIGASTGGRLADRMGRKTVFLLDMSLLVLAAALSAFAWNAWIMIFSQLLVGVAIGMDFPVSSSYVAECMPHRGRSRMMVATIACQSVGILLAAGLALGLLHMSTSPHTWRLFFASESLLAALYLLARLRLPESPRWLMGQGRNREAVYAFGTLVPTDHNLLAAMATRLDREVHYVAKVPKQTTQMGFSILFHSAYRRRTLLCTLPWFLMDIATYGVGLFTAVLLGAMHLLGTASGPTAHDEALASGSGVIDIFLLLGFLLGLWAVARFGRIRMQSIGFAGMALGMGILFASTLLQGDAGQHIALVFAGFVVFNLSMNMGPNSTTYILPAELFPTQVRATAAGFAAASAKVGATMGVFLLPLLKADLGVPTVLALMAGVSLLGLCCTLLFRVEGQGLTLEQHHE